MTEKAKDFIKRAEALGSKLSVQGNWVVAKPPLPVPMILEMRDISDDIAVVLNAHPVDIN